MPQPLKTPALTPWDLTFGQGRNQTKFGFSPASFTENLTKFETEESVQNVSGFPHVISVVESERIAYSFKIKENDFVAGDIVLWDGEKKVVADPNGFSLPESGYTPIGIVVIPASHMDDGHARMMSTRWMSCDDPENGSLTQQRMVWGAATDLSGLTNFTDFPVIARYDDEDQVGVVPLTVPQVIYGASIYAFLPSDKPNWTGETNPEDPGTRWRQSKSYWGQNETGGTVVEAYNFYAPSPYASDGTPNPLYRATSYSGGSLNNPLSYFDGRHQSDVILEARGAKDYDSWKPTRDTPEDYPAASCCDMYHTVGTSQGDWYLPSQAELGYVVPRLNEITNAMTKMNGMQILLSYWAWSSSEYSSPYANTVNFDNGSVNNWGIKESALGLVVAFCPV